MALLLAGYFAQHYLPPPKPKIVGIDLGKYKYKMYTHVLLLVKKRMNIS